MLQRLARNYLPLLLIFWLAFALRTYQLTEIPPGLTHDEANHGRDSINILDGVLLFYFPLNYGSEPLYNYLVSGNMILLGENLFALRLVTVFFGLLTIAAAYRWARQAFGWSTGLLAAALLAVSFWPLAASRQALRAGILPFLAVMAILFFWQIVQPRPGNETAGPAARRRQLLVVAGFALAVAATLHTYLAARVLWLLFPLFLLYLALAHRAFFRRSWRPVLIGLLAAGLLVIPMFAYLQAHPEADTRLEMLDGPLQNLAQGNLGPVFENIRDALLAFVWPGYGDQFLAYNIPGRPVFETATAVFFVLGLGACLWRWRQPANALLLLWFGAGIIPSLVTGPTANTTRNMGGLAAVYLLPAVGFMALAGWTGRRWPQLGRYAVPTAAAAWLLLAGSVSVRDYFDRWAQAPDVRAAYQHTLVEALAYLEDEPVTKPVVISSVYPGAAHDPSIARVLVGAERADFRWVDGRYALVFPSGQAAALIAPASTPLHPAFNSLLAEMDRVALRNDDLDPWFALYQMTPGGWTGPEVDTNFGDAVVLERAWWWVDPVSPGQTAELVTLWRVTDPARVGPPVPPAFETDVVIFTQVLDPAGTVMAQRDSLEAPAWGWQAGDLILQIHPVFIPPETAAGRYETIVGIYDRLSGDRLPVHDDQGQIAGDRVFVVPLVVNEG
jgi:hypothetical protein